jgi:hypothetical protein
MPDVSVKNDSPALRGLVNFERSSKLQKMTRTPPSSLIFPGPISGRPWRIAGVILLVLLVLAGIVYSFVLPPVARFPDEAEYLALVHSLLHGPGYSMDGVHLTASRPPGYPFFLTELAAIGAGVKGMRLAQYALLAGTILLVCRIAEARQRLGPLLPVTGLVLVYPVLFYTAATLYPQTLAGFLFVTALALLLTGKRGFLLDFATGLTWGALFLTVPTFVLTFVVVLTAAWALGLLRWRSGLIIILGAGILVGAWTLRNEVEFHQFVPFASNSGENFLIGNSENTVPYGGSGNVDRTHYQQEARTLGLDEFQQDRYYRQAALRWIADHPGRAAVLYLEKVLNFFNGWNEYAPENQAEVSVWKQVIMAATYAFLLALLVWRLAEIRRFPPEAWEKLFLITYVLSAFTLAIFFTRIRHRLPYDYLIIAVIAAHLSRRLQGWLGEASSIPPAS